MRCHRIKSSTYRANRRFCFHVKQKTRSHGPAAVDRSIGIRRGQAKGGGPMRCPFIRLRQGTQTSRPALTFDISTVRGGRRHAFDPFVPDPGSSGRIASSLSRNSREQTGKKPVNRDRARATSHPPDEPERCRHSGGRGKTAYFRIGLDLCHPRPGAMRPSSGHSPFQVDGNRSSDRKRSTKALRRTPSWLIGMPRIASCWGVAVSVSTSRRASSMAAILVAKARSRPRPDTAPRRTLPGQPLVRVVGPEAEAILGPRREHAIGLGDATGHEIVDHDADVGLRAGERNRVTATGAAGRIEAGHEPLRGCFLVTRRPVDLSGQEKSPAMRFVSRTGLQFAGIDEIILDRIAGLSDDGIPPVLGSTAPNRSCVSAGRGGRKCRSGK